MSSKVCLVKLIPPKSHIVTEILQAKKSLGPNGDNLNTDPIRIHREMYYNKIKEKPDLRRLQLKNVVPNTEKIQCNQKN